MRRTQLPVSLPEGDPDIRFAPAEKVRLGGEIFRTYFLVRWLLLRKRLPDVVDRLRERGAEAGRGEGDLAAGGGWRYVIPVVKTLRVLPLDSRCLVRSLVLLAILARRGAYTTLVIGVRTKPEFGAHAWIEHQGRPLLEPGDTAQGRLLEI